MKQNKIQRMAYIMLQYNTQWINQDHIKFLHLNQDLSSIIKLFCFKRKMQ